MQGGEQCADGCRVEGGRRVVEVHPPRCPHQGVADPGEDGAAPGAQRLRRVHPTLEHPREQGGVEGDVVLGQRVEQLLDGVDARGGLHPPHDALLPAGGGPSRSGECPEPVHDARPFDVTCVLHHVSVPGGPGAPPCDFAGQAHSRWIVRVFCEPSVPAFRACLISHSEDDSPVMKEFIKE